MCIRGRCVSSATQAYAQGSVTHVVPAPLVAKTLPRPAGVFIAEISPDLQLERQHIARTARRIECCHCCHFTIVSALHRQESHHVPCRFCLTLSRCFTADYAVWSNALSRHWFVQLCLWFFLGSGAGSRSRPMLFAVLIAWALHSSKPLRRSSSACGSQPLSLNRNLCSTITERPVKLVNWQR